MSDTHHPELQEDEVFVGNSDEETFELMPYKTKRQGIVAYDTAGNPCPKLFPVFMKASEREEGKSAQQ